MSTAPEKIRKLSAHIFVCLNERPTDAPRGCCKAKDSEALLKALKEEISRRGLSHQVRAQKSGCLDVCEYGAAVVVYPEGVWYGGVRAGDVPELVESHLIGGKPIERLKIPGK